MEKVEEKVDADPSFGAGAPCVLRFVEEDHHHHRLSLSLHLSLARIGETDTNQDVLDDEC